MQQTFVKNRVVGDCHEVRPPRQPSGRRMNKKVSQAGKDLLVNTIKIVNHQNKVKEENEMWKVYEEEKKRRKRRTSDERRSSRKDGERSRSSGSRSPEDRKRRKSSSGDKNYWLKKLYEVEEKSAERWGHGGFKELYPEEFEGPKRKKKKTKTKKHRS